MAKTSGQTGMARYLSRKLIPLSAGIALLIGVLSPVAFWTIEHRSLRHMATLYAEHLAEEVQRLSAESPELWKYQSIEFMAISEGFHPSIDVDGFRILDEKGEPVSGFEQKGEWLRRAGKLTFSEELGLTLGSAPIMLNNRRIGTVEVFACDTRLLRASVLLFCLSLLVGTALAVLVYRFPVRVVRKMEGEIDNLISGLRQSEENYRALNEVLEQKVEEKTKQLLAAQEELVRREKLATLGKLAGSVGHELRNPLGVMSNAIYFLKTVLTDADKTTKEYLEIVKNEIDNSERIITDLLDFARTKTPQTRTITAGELVNQSLGKCAIPEGVTVRIDIPETLPSIKVDPLQMSQVLQNLISNRVQAMPEGGALSISAKAVQKCRSAEARKQEDSEISALPNFCTSDYRNFVEISVADTGTGISPENMAKLFQPLFTTKARGIGLGLVVCKNLAEANGGRIEVASELQKGTIFTVILPVERDLDREQRLPHIKPNGATEARRKK